VIFVDLLKSTPLGMFLVEKYTFLDNFSGCFIGQKF
jgi:hypothetical protein